MANVETSISINKPVEKVFDFLTNLQNQKALNSSITDVVISGKVAVGTRYKIKGTVMGRTFESENEIVAIEPNAKFSVKTLGRPARLGCDQRLQSGEEWQRHKITLIYGRGSIPRDREPGDPPTQGGARYSTRLHKKSSRRMITNPPAYK